MLILALDTTDEQGSLALARDEDLLECRELRGQQTFASVVFLEILSLLKSHGFRLDDVELYAAAAGPGSFTGVRVGLSAAKGLAVVRNVPVAAISNLKAVAALAPAGPRIIIPVLDARRGEWYAGAYERRESQFDLRALMQETAASAAALAERLHGLNLPRDETAVCGPDAANFPLESYARVETPRVLAAAIARFGLEAHRRGETQAAAAVDANYVRRSDSELFLK